MFEKKFFKNQMNTQHPSGNIVQGRNHFGDLVIQLESHFEFFELDIVLHPSMSLTNVSAIVVDIVCHSYRWSPSTKQLALNVLH